MLTNLWNKIKDFFKRSETIFIARLEAVAGFLVAVIGGLDPTALLSLDISNGVTSSTTLIFGLVWFLKGIIQEWARRRNANL